MKFKISNFPENLKTQKIEKELWKTDDKKWTRKNFIPTEVKRSKVGADSLPCW